MKYLTGFIFFLTITSNFAQKACDFTTNVTDSIGSYKTTKEYLLYEKNFAGNATYIFGSLILTDEKALFNLQLIEKSADFIKAKCLDKNSRIFLQLNNNKIVTLSFASDESCGTLVRDDKGLNNRILSGYFNINKSDYENLKQSQISFIRIKFVPDTADFVMKKELKSELNNEVYQPESYFINFVHCLESKN
jgi:hypothetical protein